MGFVRTRIDGNGTPRYLALYNDVKGRQRSAGTFNTPAQAEKAWRRAEDRISEGSARRCQPRASEVPALCRRNLAAAPSDGGPYPGELHLLPAPAHPARLRQHADDRDPPVR